MASSNQSAKQYVKDAHENIVGCLLNLSLVVEKLHQQKVFNGEEVGIIESEPEKYNKTRKILDFVLNKGEEACYQFLRILDRERESVLPKPDSTSQAPDLQTWICSFCFKDEAEDYIQGPSSCQQLQQFMKKSAEQILAEQWEQRLSFCGAEVQGKFTFIPLVLDTNTEKNTPRNKIKLKSKKLKNPHSKKMKAYIPSNTEGKSPEDLLNSREKRILIVGKPGIGKTTVVQQMLRHWAERHGRNLDFMFYFDENTLSNISAGVTLEDLLLSTFFISNPLMKLNAGEMVQYLQENSERVTFVFDGIRDFEDNSILLKIMEQELLPEAKIVATCRSEVEYEFSDWPTCTVYVQGFSEESIRDFLKQRSHNDPELVESLINNPAVFSLCYIPMYAFMVAACILNDTSKEAQKQCTATELYIRIFRHCLQTHGKKTLLLLDGYIKNCKDMILSLAESAFNATKLKTINLKIDYDEKDISGAFLKTVSVVSPAFDDNVSAFPHNTMQEFFAALWLLEKTEVLDEVIQLCQSEENQHMKYVIPFLCGLQSQANNQLIKCLVPVNKDTNAFFEKVLNTFFCDQPDYVDIVFICQCLYELQSPESCCSFLERTDYCLDLSEEHLDPYTCCAVSYVINNSRNKQVHLDLEKSTVSLSGLRIILKHSQFLRDFSATLCQVWTMALNHEEPIYLTNLFQLCGNEIHIPRSSPTDVLEQAGKIITQTSEKINLYLHCDRYPKQLRDHVFSWLPHINTLHFNLLHGNKEDEKRSRTFRLYLCVQAVLHQPANIHETLQKIMPKNEEQSDFLMDLYYRVKRYHFQHEMKDQKSFRTFRLDLCLQAALHQAPNIWKTLKTVITCNRVDEKESDFLLDLYSHVKQYESETGRSLLPALLPVYQSAPDVWYINLSERKVSLVVEVLKLQTQKKPVELRNCPDEESEVRSFLQCLPYISQLRYHFQHEMKDQKRFRTFTLDLCLQAALHQAPNIWETLKTVITCNYHHEEQSDFLLDLYSHVKQYESETDRSLLPALLPVYQSVPDVWYINLSERKVSLVVEVLKLQTQKKPMELRNFTDEESEVRSFLQCLPYISQLRFKPGSESIQFLLNLIIAAVNCQSDTGESLTELLASVCSYNTFPFVEEFLNLPYNYHHHDKQSDFLLDLYFHVKQYESKTGRSLLPVLLPVYQSAPNVWYINLSERKVSILLEVLKLQTQKKPVELINDTDEESEVRSFLQCLPYISQLTFVSHFKQGMEEQKRCRTFRLDLCLQAALHQPQNIWETLKTVINCNYVDEEQCDFLLDLYSHMKQYESKTGRSLLPALLPVYQSVSDVWYINLSERKVSLVLEVLKLQTQKKPVELRNCPDEESEVRSFLQCLPYISQLRFNPGSKSIQFLLNLIIAAVNCQSDTGESLTELLASVCSYNTFPFVEEFLNLPYNYHHHDKQSDFLLDLYSHMKQYESKTGRSLLPALLPVYQSVPVVWSINLSERKVSLLLEVLKLQTQKKPVMLRNCPDEESEVKSFLQCLPYISQLRFYPDSASIQFFLMLSIAAVDCQSDIGESFTELLASVCSYSTFPIFVDFDEFPEERQSDFLLDLYSHMKQYESETGRSLLPALLPVYQSVPDVWYINLSERKVSLVLEVLKLQTQKKPVELRNCPDEESEVRSFLQCLPYISQLRFKPGSKSIQFLLNLIIAAVNCQSDTGESLTELLASVCSYNTFPFVGEFLNLSYNYYHEEQSDFLLDLYFHVKQYESKTGRSLLPALLPVYQSVPDVWYINLSERKVSLILEVLKLQTQKKPVELRNCPDEESEVKSFLQCLPYISQLRFNSNQITFRFDSIKFLLNLSIAAVDCQSDKGESFTELLASVCSYNTFPICVETRRFQERQSDFLLDLYSHMKQYESKTGRSLLPALLPVYQSVPDVWYINLSERKVSILLEVLKLQTQKKPVVLRDVTDEESEVRSFLQYLPYILQLRFNSDSASMTNSLVHETEVRSFLQCLPYISHLSCSKSLLLQFLNRLRVVNESDCVRHVRSLSQALDGQMDLSEIPLDVPACRSLALFLEFTEGLSKLDLSHCKLSEHGLELLFPHLHKAAVLDLSHNDIDDYLAGRIYTVVSTSSSIHTVRLINNRITDKKPFQEDNRYDI